MKKPRVLFICVHNTARSQMAEAMVNHLYGDLVIAESAGFEPGNALNPLAVEVMKEIGIDISMNKSKGVFDLFKEGRHYAFVVTVCDESTAERCPIFPGVTKRMHWSFEDPASFEGTLEDKLAKTRQVRENIRLAIDNWTEELKALGK